MLNLWRIAAAILLSFVLMGSASAQVVALGASNTQGHGVGASESYPAQLQAMLRARGSGLRVTNAGVFGDTTDGMLARLSSAVPDGTKIVILQFGGNDRGKISLAMRQANIANIQQQLRKRGIRIVQADGLVQSASGGWPGSTGSSSSNCGGLPTSRCSIASIDSLIAI